MKKQKIILASCALAALMLLPAKAKAQQPDTPKGTPIVTLFGDAGAGVTDGNLSSMGFNLERAYLGYDYKFNNQWRTRVVYDMGKGDDLALQRLGYVKNAEIDYHNGNFEMKMGLTSTTQFHLQEKFWGFRYVAKSFQDLNKWGSSADLGISASYKMGWLKADFSVFNGEGYKRIQSDKQLLYGLGLTATPVEGLSLRAYGELKSQQDTTAQYTIALFAGYRCQHFRVGAEYNCRFNHAGAEDHDLMGLSLYGAGRIGSHMEAYARYDLGQSQSPDSWQYGQDGSSILLGLQYKVNSLFSISPNVRLTQNADGSQTSVYACVSAKVNL